MIYNDSYKSWLINSHSKHCWYMTEDCWYLATNGHLGHFLERRLVFFELNIVGFCYQVWRKQFISIWKVEVPLVPILAYNLCWLTKKNWIKLTFIIFKFINFYSKYIGKNLYKISYITKIIVYIIIFCLWGWYILEIKFLKCM